MLRESMTTAPATACTASQLVPMNLGPGELREQEPDLVVLILPHGDRLDLCTVRSRTLARGFAVLPLHQGHLNFFSNKCLVESHSREDANCAAPMWTVTL